jgi:rod shape determining protein RodA
LREQKGIFHNIDRTTVILYVVLVFIGWINIYAAVYDEGHKSIVDVTQNYGKQLLWIGSSIILAMSIIIIDAKFFSAFSYLIYLVVAATLILVLLTGKEIAGSRSWFQIGSFSLQPSEFAKFATCLALARYLSKLDINIRKVSTKAGVFLIILIPPALILLQNDTGSAVVYVSLLLVLYREGLSGNIMIIGILVALLFLLSLLMNKFILIGILAAICILFVLFIRRSRKNLLRLAGIFVLASAFVYSVDYTFEHLLGEHQKDRINVLLGKETNLKDAGYNINQSKIAIGSGGFFGKGYLRGTQTKYNFVPEQSTDFIFCTVGEEWGFIGSAIVIGLYVWLLVRLIQMAERQRSAFSRIYGYGVVSILFFHFAVNIGMTLGLLPVIGIPLPFLSYGGSSLWSFTILLFIFIKQDAFRLELL